MSPASLPAPLLDLPAPLLDLPAPHFYRFKDHGLKALMHDKGQRVKLTRANSMRSSSMSSAMGGSLGGGKVTNVSSETITEAEEEGEA